MNSKKATMFRIWANRILKEYIIKGYVMDDERLKEPQNFFGKDYFEEQLERIRDIRSSERRFYQKITDIYSQCSADYDVDSPVTKEFLPPYKTNCITPLQSTPRRRSSMTGQTAQTEYGPDNMENAPSGRIRKSDVVIAKNYLDETEMGSLNEIVTMYLDYAERQARRGNIMYMRDWVARMRMLFMRRTHSIWSAAFRVSVTPSCFAIAGTMISIRSLQAWSISARCRCSVPLVSRLA